MQVICLEDAAFYDLVETVVDRLRNQDTGQQTEWVNTDEAMHILNIKSKTTLQQLRDEGKIRFSQIQKRNILYHRASLSAFIEQHAKDTF